MVWNVNAKHSLHIIRCHVVSKTHTPSPSVLAEDAIKAALSDYRLKQHDKKEELAKASN